MTMIQCLTRYYTYFYKYLCTDSNATQQPPYNEEQDEEEEVGTSILTVRATDRDQINTNNSLVAYSLNNAPDAIFFYIDNMTGVISNAMILVCTVLV